MPAPIPLPVRQMILRRRLLGQSPALIAAELGVSTRCVHLLLRRCRRHGEQGLATSYRRGRGAPAALLQRAADYRGAHRSWGAELIRVHLQRDFPQLPVPCARTLQRHFASRGLAPARPGRRPAPRRRRAEQPHLVWQMDAAEEIALARGQKVSWLRLVDECSGAFLWTVVFPQGKFNQVAPRDVQQALRGAFAVWGLPGQLRVDNGFPWGSAGDLPTDLALWLIGLGVGMWWNTPGRPEENGVVERSQGTAKRWGEPHTCGSGQELQARIEALDELQRCRYPFRQGRSRWQWYAELAHSGREYAPGREAQQWDWGRVGEHLGAYCVKRKVDEKGQIWIYNRHYYAGRRCAGGHVLVEFDAAKRCWVALSAAGAVIREIPAEQLSAERIRALEVTHRRDRGK